MTTAQAAYDELVRLSRERTLLASCLELLGWDELTYMPRGGVENRGQQTAYLSGLHHERATHPRLAELLDTVERSPLVAESDEVAVNVRRWRWEFDRLVRLPRALIEQLARVTTTAQQAWAVARQNNDYRQFAPWLTRVLELVRARAECLTTSAVLCNAVLYDAVLEDYEPGATTQQLTALFTALRPELTRLLSAIGDSRVRVNVGILRREFPLDRQRILGETVAAEIGFDFDRGRLDATTHPFFSAIGPGDCRITTRYNPNDFSESFFSMLHELGHAFYEQGLDARHYGTPLGESSSLGIHESQSRLWENAVGRSLAFWRHFFPRTRELFHDALRGVKVEEFHRAINHVQPGPNRVRADEASYDLHILVRFELEQALLTGVLSADELPAAWNEKYREYLGVTPLDDASGCLQDSHWAAGQFGYFPTYTLGNVYAAQFVARAREELGNLDEQISGGKFQDLCEWLRVNIYRHGQRYSATELVERVTGNPPQHVPLLDALWSKYREPYAL